MQELSVGIDIGGTNVSYGIVTKEGEVISKKSFPFSKFETPEIFVDFFSDELKTAFKILSSESSIKGIGIGAPNGNFYTGSIEFAPNLKWDGVIPLADMLNKKLNYPVKLTNDANAATVGEIIYGNAKGMKNFMFITLGTGVGSGFVANGELILGHDGFAGELGHAIFDPNGRECNCGRKGCLETYASASGIVRTVKELLSESDEPSTLRDISSEELTSKLIYDAAKKGDIIALTTFDYTGFVLGFMLANAATITSPEAIFLFGGLANAGDFIFEPTKLYLEENLLKIFQNKIDLIPSALPENDAAILGAAALVWDED